MIADTLLLHRYHHEGDATAFAELVQAHSSMVFATARRITRDATLAAEVAQESFLSLSKAAGKDIHSVAGWLHRVTWQRACDTVRRETARQRHEPAAVSWHETKDPAWAEIESVVDEVLNELPEATRTLLIEHFFERHSQSLLAQKLGVSQATISRQLDSGVEELRRRLKHRGFSCSAGLAALLTAHAAEAIPATLLTSLTTIGLAGLGVSQATLTTGGLTLLATMTPITKILAGTAAVILATAVPVVVLNSPDPTSASVAAASPSPRALPLASAPTAPLPPSPSPTASSPVLPSAPSAALAVASPAPGTPPPPARKHFRPKPVTPDVRAQVDALIQRLSGLTEIELTQNEEVIQIGQRFEVLLSHPETVKKLETRVQALKDLSQLQYGVISFSTKSSDSPFLRAIFEAVLSNDRERAAEVLLHQLDGAIFEYALDPSVGETANGVSITPSLLPPPLDRESD